MKNLSQIGNWRCGNIVLLILRWVGLCLQKVKGQEKVKGRLKGPAQHGSMSAELQKKKVRVVLNTFGRLFTLLHTLWPVPQEG